MRKREFVGICAVGAAIIGVFAFLFGKHNFKCGYKERDKTTLRNTLESFKFI